MYLQEFNLRDDLELLPPLVKVDEAVGKGVVDGSVDHRQVSQERTQVRDRSVADGLQF